MNAFAAIGPDLSPDGTSLVYGQNGGNLSLADLRQTQPVVVDLGTNGSAPRFSPDGHSIAYWHGDSLQIMDVTTRATTEGSVASDRNR